ncbi:hypothetical protein BABINDRAFT_10091, partial [Babjeviella inositovora NRRL Y-12698]
MPDNETSDKSSELAAALDSGTGISTYNVPNRASDPSALGLDDEEEDFVQKYGSIQVVYIKKPKHSPWWTRPYALNYFYNGT